MSKRRKIRLPRRRWYSDLRTADDVAMARQVLMRWSEHTADADAAARMAERITARAVELGLEQP